jgi:hypothetical protein
VNALDQSEFDKTINLGYALEGVLTVAKARGMIVGYIIDPSAKRSQQH